MAIFYGQEKLIKELKIIADKCKIGENFNLLFRGKSGQGKTTLANMFLSWASNDFNNTISILATDEDFSEYFSNKRFIFIDEIHELKKPEWLYSHLDKNISTFILATNETGILKEPLLNRCIPLTELVYMAEQSLNFKLDNVLLQRIVEVGKYNPRKIVKGVCKRLNYLLKEPPKSLRELEKQLNQLGYINGLDPLEREYIEALKYLGGTASLTLLCGILKLTKETIVRDIEPYLFNKIKITGRGRILL
jgi:Holliday junction resolvasome RuvABC ATP-dependent DNA helicase subunit